MTALEYMEKQVEKHRANFQREALRDAPAEQLRNIREKIWYYQEAADALRACQEQQAGQEIDFDYEAED